MKDSFAELLKTRRSIRKYKTTAIEKHKLDMCLEAARLAPSACNAQPWKFITLSEPEQVAAFSAEVFGGVYAMTAFARKAPVLVAVVADKGNIVSWVGNQVRNTAFSLIDIGIACENFVLQAHELGLGTCIIGWFNEKNAAKYLKCPSGRKVELLISVGYPDENPEPRPRKKLEDISSQNFY
ncbi:MAG: nitroreductase family protein [Elusimicrobiaceae bacterium]|jgi:nitroreductase